MRAQRWRARFRDHLIWVAGAVLTGIAVWTRRNRGERPVADMLTLGKPLPEFLVFDKQGNLLRSTEPVGPPTVMLFCGVADARKVRAIGPRCRKSFARNTARIPCGPRHWWSTGRASSVLSSCRSTCRIGRTRKRCSRFCSSYDLPGLLVSDHIGLHRAPES